MTYGTFRQDENKAVADASRVDVRHEIRSGDLLLSRANTREYVGSTVLVGPCRSRLLLSDKSLRLKPRADIDSRWLYHALSAPESRRYLSERSTGVKSGMRNISQELLRGLPLPVPPLAEQRRIVDVLENHLSRLDAALRLLGRGTTKVGSLLESWLASRPDPADTHLRPLASVLASPLRHGRSVPTADSGFPVLRLTALRTPRVDLSKRKVGAWSAAEAAPYLVQAGDFLVARGSGSLSIVGRGSLVDDQPDPVAYPDTSIRVRVAADHVTPQYLALVWNSHPVRKQLEAFAKTTAGIHKVNQADLGQILLPIPPLDTQKKIASEAALLADNKARFESQTS